MKTKFAVLIRAYFGAKTKGYDAAMRKATRGHPLSYEDEMRNKRISSKRSPVEWYFAFAKRVCKAGHIAVTTIGRVRVKMIITGLVFNLYHLISAKNKSEHSVSCLEKSKNIGRIRGKWDALRPNQIVCIGIMDRVLYGNHQFEVNQNPRQSIVGRVQLFTWHSS